MSENELSKPEVRLEPDGRLSFKRTAPMDYSSPVPEGLLRNPPKWAESLIGRGATFVEFVEALGEAALHAESRPQHRTILRLVEQLALTDEGRQTIDRILTPRFIHWLTTATSTTRVAFFLTAIIAFENANAPGRWAWISTWEDETVWPVATLQALVLDQAISAVWQDTVLPFVELFLFDGVDLEGRLTRIARVQTGVPELELVLDAPSLDNQSRSLQSADGVVAKAYSSKCG